MKEYIRLFQQAKQYRSTYEQRWQQVSDYINPNQDFTVIRTPGQDRSAFIYDVTARNANETLIAGLHGQMTSPYMRWCTLASNDLKTQGDKLWLSNLEQYIFDNVFFNTDTGFNTQMHEFYRDLVTYGTGVLHIRFDEVAGNFRFRSRPLSQCYIQQNDEGQIDTLFVYAEKPVIEVPYQSEKLDKLRKENPNAKVNILQVCMPRDENTPTYRGGPAKQKPFKYCVYDMTHNEELEESGFDWFPFIVCRFNKRSGEIYGDSPALNALPAVKALNQVNEFGVRGLMKSVDPTLQLEDDTILGNSPIVQNPGSIIYRRPGSEPVAPLITNPNPQFAIEFIEYLRRDIVQMFHADWFNMPTQPNMTATEYLQREQQNFRRLSPMVSRIEQEGLSRIVQIVIDTVIEYKLYPQLGDIQYEIKYTSPIAQAQSSVQMNSLNSTLMLYAQIAEMTQSTDIFMNLNLDRVARKIPLEVLKLDPEFITSEKDMAVAQEAAAQEKQAAQSAMMAETLSKSGKNAAGAIQQLSKASQEAA